MYIKQVDNISMLQDHGDNLLLVMAAGFHISFFQYI